MKTWHVFEATEDEFLELQPLEEPKEASFNVMGVRIVRGLVGDMSMPRTYGSKIEVSG